MHTERQTFPVIVTLANQLTNSNTVSSTRLKELGIGGKSISAELLHLIKPWRYALGIALVLQYLWILVYPIYIVHIVENTIQYNTLHSIIHIPSLFFLYVQSLSIIVFFYWPFNLRGPWLLCYFFADWILKYGESLVFSPLSLSVSVCLSLSLSFSPFTSMFFFAIWTTLNSF